MRKTSTLFLLLIACYTKAQTTFQLQDLQLPNVQRHVFRLNVGASNSTRNTPLNNRNIGLNTDVIFNPTYTGYKNFRYRQSFTNASLNLRPGSKRTTEEIGPDSNRINQEMFLQSNLSYSTDQYFYNSKYWFIGYHASTNLAFDGLKKRRNNDLLEENSGYNLHGNLGVHFGKGRLDPIDQGHTAFFMMRDLQRDIDFNRSPESAEYVELSNLIAKLRQMRNFDSRYRRIDQLEQLDSFFVSKGLVNECSPTFYTRVLDNFLYVNVFNRMNGKRWIVSLIPFYQRDFNFSRKQQLLENETNVIPGITGTIKRERYKQRSNTVQDYYAYGARYAASTTYNRTWNNISSFEKLSESEQETSTVQVFANREIQFFPRTRTNFYVNGQASILSSLQSSNTLPIAINVLASAGGYYYISPATRLTGSIGLGAQQTVLINAGNPSMGLNYNFNISLLHNIF